MKLFEQEVPEIYDSTVVIKGAVREAGDRAKVAVYSRERDVDPVGACVGMKGTRVQAIIRELRGEKIDIVEWSEDPVTFVTNALSPARVQRVTVVDDANRVIEVVVEDAQLSLAIGKKGQNVRLAAKLAGWRIDIKNEEEKRAEVEAQFAGLEAVDESAILTVPGLDRDQLRKLSEAGLDTADLLLEATTAQLSETVGADEATAEQIQTAVREQVEAAERAPPAAEAAVEAEREEVERSRASDEIAGPTETDGSGETAPGEATQAASPGDVPPAVEAEGDVSQDQTPAEIPGEEAENEEKAGDSV